MAMTSSEPRVTLHTPGDQMRDALREYTGTWWLFLVAGVAWMIISAVVMRFDLTSVATVGALLGVVFLVAGTEEAFVAAVRPSWRWAHVLLAVAYVMGATWCFIRPVEAFWALAAVFGLLLILRGSLDIVSSATSHDVNPIWGLGLAVGILEVLLGFWASQQMFPAQAVLVMVMVGFYAIFRGIADIVLGFELRSAHKDIEHATS